jgi:uncharacterized membrane protein YkoI
MEEKREYIDRKLLIAGILASVLSITIATAFLLQSAAAQTNSTTTIHITSQLPQINGSVNVQQEADKFIQDNVKVTFNTAASTAQSQVEGGSVVAGYLGVVQGYLVYTFNLANYDEGTSRIVIVDAGNGQVLYTSDALPLHYGELGGLGCPGGGDWHHHLGGYGMNWGGLNKGTGMTTPSTSNTNAADNIVQTTSV